MSTAQGKIPVACPRCGKNLLVPASVAGKQGRCPACQHVFLISAPPLVEEDLEPLPDLAPLDDSFAPLASDPFATGASSGYTLQSPPPQPFQNYQASPQPQHALANQYMANAAASMQQQGAYAPKGRDTDEGWGTNAGIGGGLLLMLGAVLWFVLGIVLADRIFFYPPIMFIIGLIAFFKGIAGKMR